MNRFSYFFASFFLFFAPNYAEANNSGFVFGGDNYKLHNQNSTVLIYTHGSLADNRKDPCLGKSQLGLLNQPLGSFKVPKVFEKLSEKLTDELAVFFICHQEIGDYGGRLSERYKEKPCEPYRRPKAKFCKRISKIESELEKVYAANPELDPSKVFLTGHSSGGWTSLIVVSRNSNIAKGVIAFAPATNGKLAQQIKRSKGGFSKKRKRCGVEQKTEKIRIPKINSGGAYLLNICQIEFIRSANPSALIFAFENDPYNSPFLLKDLDIASRITVESVEQNLCLWSLLSAFSTHSCHQTRAFIDRHIETIAQYITRP